MLLFAAALAQPMFELSSGTARLQFPLEGGAWRIAAFRPDDLEPWMETSPPSPGRLGAGFRWESCRVTPGRAELVGKGPGGASASLTIAAQGEGEFTFSYRLQKPGGFRAASALEWWRSGQAVRADVGRLGGQEGGAVYGPLALWDGRINGGEAEAELMGEGLMQGPLIQAVKDETGLAWGPLARAEVQFPEDLSYSLRLDLTPGGLDVAEAETSLPQALPWIYMCRPLLSMGADPLDPSEADLLPEGARRLWWSESADGLAVGGPIGETISWGASGNAQAAAYGLLAWGSRLSQGSWTRMGHELTGLLIQGKGAPYSPDRRSMQGGPDPAATAFWLRESLPFLNEALRPRAEALLAELPAASSAAVESDAWTLAQGSFRSSPAWANGLPLRGAYLPMGSTRVELTATLDHARRLMLAGEETQNAGLMRLGAAGLRSAFGMLSFGLQMANNMPDPPVFDGRTASGFDLATGQWLEPSTFLSGPLYLLAHMALAEQRFGDAFELTSGEKVGLNALAMTPEGPVSLLSKIAFPYTDQETIRVGLAGGGERTETVVKPLGIRGLRIALHDGQVGAEAVPSSVLLGGPAGAGAEFTLNGKSSPSQFSNFGYFGPIGTPEAAPSSVEAELRLNGRLVGTARLVSRITDEPYDWPTRSGALLNYRWKSLPGGWISTADDGTGAPNPGLQGALQSLPFLATGISLTFEYQAAGGAELILWAVDKQIEVDRIPLDERQTGVGVMDLTKLTGQRLQLILRDPGSESWVQIRRPQQG